MTIATSVLELLATMTDLLQNWTMGMSCAPQGKKLALYINCGLMCVLIPVTILLWKIFEGVMQVEPMVVDT